MLECVGQRAAGMRGSVLSINEHIDLDFFSRLIVISLRLIVISSLLSPF